MFLTIPDLSPSLGTFLSHHLCFLSVDFAPLAGHWDPSAMSTLHFFSYHPRGFLSSVLLRNTSATVSCLPQPCLWPPSHRNHSCCFHLSLCLCSCSVLLSINISNNRAYISFSRNVRYPPEMVKLVLKFSIHCLHLASTPWSLRRDCLCALWRCLWDCLRALPGACHDGCQQP